MRKPLDTVPENTRRAVYPGLAAGSRLKHRQSGMTLLEVVVAMFLLAVGVLALLATQLRTVSSVREAESQTIVAQAVQNLMEGMQLNPTLSQAAGGDGWIVKRYDDNTVRIAPGSSETLSYRLSNPVKVRTCDLSKLCKPDTSTALNKRAILEDQLGRFENQLATALPNNNIQYVICNDTTGRPMSISTTGAVSPNCSGSNGDPLFVKVLWQVETEQKHENDRPLKANDTKLVYTYEARLAN